MTEASARNPNPFVGPRAIEYGEPIFGREQETRKLANLLLANRILLMHSPSGAGKTSLIQAALLPRLSGRNFNTLPPIRLNLSPPAEVVNLPGFNPYAFSAMASLEEGRPSGARLPLAELAQMRLSDYLARLELSRLFLIFDQFEEILTANPFDQDGKAAFFEQLGEALSQPDCWALFAMREDYLGALEPYQLPVPTRFKHTFRLNLLEKDAARQVVQQTTALENVHFTDQAAERLIEDLTRVKVQLPDGSFETESGLFIEPVHLQVVCRDLWEQRNPDDPDITVDEIEQIGDVDESLARYYAAQTQTLASSSGIPERNIRTWFDRQLITENGVRSQVLMGQEQSAGLNNPAIQKLVDAHLVRRDTRRGATWFELAHDRLIVPIRENNKDWFNQNLVDFQRQAALWQAENRPARLLMRGEALQSAEDWAQANPGALSQDDRDFLQACIEARQQEEDALKLEQERHRSRRARQLLLVITLALLIAISLGVFSAIQTIRASQLARDNQDLAITAFAAQANALDQKGTAESEKATADLLRLTAEAGKTTADQLRGTAEIAKDEAVRQAEIAKANARLAFAGRLASQGGSLLDSQPDLAALLAVESNAITQTWESQNLLLDLVQLRVGQEVQPFGLPIPESQSPISAFDLSPDGIHLAWGTLGGDVTLWNYQTNMVQWSEHLHTGNVISLDFSPDGKWLASGGVRPELHVTDVETGESITDLSSKVNNRIYALAFNPRQPWLAVVILNRIEIWRYTGEVWDKYVSFPVEPDWISTLAWSPDGTLLASGEFSDNLQPNNGVVIWDPRSVTTKRPFPSESTTNSLAWSPDGRLLAAGTNSGGVRFWDMNAVQEITEPVLPDLERNVSGVSFNPDGYVFARAGLEKAVTLFNIQDFSTIKTIGDPNDENVQFMQFSPTGGFNLLGVVFENKSSHRQRIGLYLVTPQQPISREVQTGAGAVVSLGAGPGGGLRLLRNFPGSAVVSERPDGASGTASDEQTIFTQPGSFDAWAISPSGDRLALWEQGEPVLIYALPSGEQLQSIDPGTPFAESLAFSPDGHLLAIGSCASVRPEIGVSYCAQGEVRLWDIDTGGFLNGPPLLGHDDFISALAFSPDGSILASGSRDTTIQLWDLGTSSESGPPLRRHTGGIASLAFSPDGKTLASGGTEGSLILWDLGVRQPIGAPLLAGHQVVTALSFFSQGDILAGYTDGSLLAWDVDLGHWVQIACQIASGRTLNAAELLQYFPLGDYKDVCGSIR